MAEESFHVFLSHCSADRRTAEHLTRDLELKGYRVRMSSTKPEDGIPQSNIMCVYWTEAAGDSMRVRREITAADKLGRTIILLQFDDTPPHTSVHMVYPVDFRSSYQRGMEALVSRLGSIFGDDDPHPKSREEYDPHAPRVLAAINLIIDFLLEDDEEDLENSGKGGEE